MKTDTEQDALIKGSRPRSQPVRRRLSPGRRQYLHFKSKYADALLLFRMGDFYECFDEDARTLSKLLDVALTARDVGGGVKAPLAGIPHHSLDNYLGKLVGAGLKVAIAEQTSSKPNSEGIVERAVVQVVTPGTILDASLLEETKHNYLAVCVVGTNLTGLAWLDASTSEFAAMELRTSDVIEQIERLEPAEILVNGVAKELLDTAIGDGAGRKSALSSTVVRQLDDALINAESSAEGLKRHFDTDTLEPFELSGCPLATIAAASALDYLAQTQIGRLPLITTLRRHRPDRYMHMPSSALRDLEVLKPTEEGGRTLLSSIDMTHTPMGARLVRNWLSSPLTDLEELNTRQLAVDRLHSNATVRLSLDRLFVNTPDMPRLVSRLTLGRAAPREMRSLSRGLEKMPRLIELITDPEDGKPVSPLFDGLSLHTEIRELINRAIVDDPPLRASDGGAIRAGFDHDLDALRQSLSQARTGILEIEEKARVHTGIRNLKVGHNRVFGYYIEVSRSQVKHVPPEYQRRQTLVNSERYITPELKYLENHVMRTSEQIIDLEQSIYRRVCQQVAEQGAAVMRTANAMAHIDVCMSLASVAADNHWVMPFLDRGDTLQIEDGRHPVVEEVLGYGRFVPNDVSVSNSGNQILIITGPNMSGKSTYIRQAALLVILAQIGSFVPAKNARIGVVDRIFTRIGISDDIAGGRSTFMVEMVETASILHQATPRSLAILDEIGRGTSTYDGLAIARSVAEFIHNSPTLGCKTLFATHYHEMTELGDTLPRAQNLRVAVAEEGDNISFLYRILPGSADRSYGVHVAMLAGMPSPVVDRARELLTQLEANTEHIGLTTGAASTLDDQRQLGFFNNGDGESFLRRVADIDADNLSPIEALNRLYELRETARKALSD